MTQPRESNTGLSGAAERIMRDLVVRRGLSYEAAILWAEDQAIEVAAPYREVAGYLRRQLMGHDR